METSPSATLQVLSGISDDALFSADADRLVARILDSVTASARRADVGDKSKRSSADNDEDGKAAAGRKVARERENRRISQSLGLTVEALSQVVLQAASQARLDFGRTRIELGFLLTVVKEQCLWEGRAESFGSFLDSIHLNSSAANQYMKVAQAFMRDESGGWQQVPEETMRVLCSCSMTVLVKAASIWRAADQETVLSILDTLSDEDALESLDSIAFSITNPGVEPVQPEQDPRVKRVLRQIEELPADLRNLVKSKARFMR